jgi:hypothetical protein
MAALYSSVVVFAGGVRHSNQQASPVLLGVPLSPPNSQGDERQLVVNLRTHHDVAIVGATSIALPNYLSASCGKSRTSSASIARCSSIRPTSMLLGNPD